MAAKRSWPLHIFLAKPEVHDAAHLLEKRGEGLTRAALRRSAGLSGAVFFKQTPPHPPEWVDFVGPALSGDPLANLLNASSSAVLVTPVADRMFAITFGHGRSTLNLAAYVRDFGLKVTLNAVDAEKIRSVDLTTHEELTFQTRVQASRAVAIPSFGIDVTRDMLRGVTGEPRDPTLATRLTGAEGLTLVSQTDVSELGVKLKQTLLLYGADAYKENFGWIDHLRVVRDPARVGQLDDLLLRALDVYDADEVGSLHLAPPEPIDWEDTERFAFSTESDSPQHTDLELADYLSSVANRRHRRNLTVSDLKHDKALVFRAANDPPIAKWSIYDCVVFETRDGTYRYALTGGEWFEIDRPFAAQVEAAIAAIPGSTLQFPRCHRGEEEGAYNVRAASVIEAAQHIRTFVLDRQLIRAAGSLTRFEVCDLITERGEFVHVKKKTRSSTLSHLFVQGLVSAETFLADGTVRRQARELTAAVPQVALRFPDLRPDPRGYEVVFAVVSRGFDPTLRALPFLSQVGLRNVAARLQTYGFQVSLARVNEA